MAAPRHPFFHPNLTRVLQICEPPSGCAIRFLFSSGSRPRVSIYTSRQNGQKSYQQHYCPAGTPSPRPLWRLKDRSFSQPNEVALTGNGGLNRSEGKNSPPQRLQSLDTKRATTNTSSSAPLDTRAVAYSNQRIWLVESKQQGAHLTENDGIDASAPCPRGTGTEKSQIPPYPNQGALDDAIHMPSPSAYLTPPGPATRDNKRPHLTAAPNVYHFDTYSFVHNISKGSFTNDQSVTIMKAVRNVLKKNIDFANQSLTFKSDVETESYLFKAACSELRSFFQTARNSEMQRQHVSRIQLQQESDILSQRLDQEIAGTKDGIKGMFNDHSMTARELQRNIDTLLYELNYKITVSLNNDGKSEIEGIRWTLISRAALTVATCACRSFILLPPHPPKHPPTPNKI